MALMSLDIALHQIKKIVCILNWDGSESTVRKNWDPKSGSKGGDK